MHKLLGIVKSVAFVLALLAAYLARPSQARAQVPAFSTGPSVQAFRIGWHPRDLGRLNLGNQSGIDLLGGGVGWSVHYNPPALVRGNVCWLSLDATAFADLNGLPLSGGMAIAGGLSTYNGLVGFAAGYKLFELYDPSTGPRPMEGLFAGGNGGLRNLFFLFNVSINIAFKSSSTTVKMSRARLAPGQSPPPNYWQVVR